MSGATHPRHDLGWFVDNQSELHSLDVAAWIDQRTEDVTGNDARSSPILGSLETICGVGQSADRSGALHCIIVARERPEGGQPISRLVRPLHIEALCAPVNRPLSTWEHDVLVALAAVESAETDAVRESIPHLVVTGGCACGCASFNVMDRRHPAQPHHLQHFANGVAADGQVGFVLWLGPDGRPISVDVENEPGVLPDLTTIIATAP